MKKYKILVGIFILAILGYIYAGPNLTINKIKKSIKVNDPQGLMENIDIIMHISLNPNGDFGQSDRLKIKTRY